MFGEVRTGSLPSQPDWDAETFLFTREQYDYKARQHAGSLYYLRARYYDPSIGRLLSWDPLPFPNLRASSGYLQREQVHTETSWCATGARPAPGLADANTAHPVQR